MAHLAHHRTASSRKHALLRAAIAAALLHLIGETLIWVD